jgi:hypothetical protein
MQDVHVQLNLGLSLIPCIFLSSALLQCVPSLSVSVASLQKVNYCFVVLNFTTE